MRHARRGLYGSAGQTCTGVDTFESCIEGHCESQARECFGANYKNGNFAGGKCASFIGCSVKCACGDTACQSNCAAQLSSDCMTCASSFSTCQTWPCP